MFLQSNKKNQSFSTPVHRINTANIVVFFANNGTHKGRNSWLFASTQQPPLAHIAEILYGRNKTKTAKRRNRIRYILSLGNPITTEMIAQAGFDWVVIDLEHGLGDEQVALHQILSIKNSNTTAIVRVESHQKQRIHRVLDFGAGGIMCPRVDTAEDASLAIRAMKYPPAGIRGVAKMIPAAGYGADFEAYPKDN